GADACLIRLHRGESSYATDRTPAVLADRAAHRHRVALRLRGVLQADAAGMVAQRAADRAIQRGGLSQGRERSARTAIPLAGRQRLDDARRRHRRPAWAAVGRAVTDAGAADA